jgi:hypothetical protein
VSDLDPGIVLVVNWLRSHGFQTVDSGDGVSKSGEAREIPYPHVFMVVSSKYMVQEADRLAGLLKRELGIAVTTSDKGVVVECSYSPADGVAILSLLYLDDREYLKSGITHKGGSSNPRV